MWIFGKVGLNIYIYILLGHYVINTKMKIFHFSHDPVFINLTEKPEWYTASVPTGKVPALKTEGSILYESLIISDYLDEKYEGKLSASTPLQKALDKIFIESFGSKVRLIPISFPPTDQRLHRRRKQNCRLIRVP